MTKSIGYVVVCVLGLGACSYERYDDCDWSEHDSEATGGTKSGGGSASRAGSAGSAGTSGSAGGAQSGGSGGGAQSGGSSGGAQGGGSSGDGDGESAGASGAAPEPSEGCDEERDCQRGFNCDLDAHQCVAADAETCPELATEAACSNRRDCLPIYAGIGCSCGQDCQCQGGEPGCVCDSFAFAACESAGD